MKASLQPKPMYCSRDYYYSSRRTTPLGQGLPSPATLLFNCLVRGIMPVMDRPPININNGDGHHKTLMHRQGKNGWGSDTSTIFMPIPIGSTVVVQWEDRGPWTHGTVVDKGNHNHHNRSYKTHVTKTGRIITHSRQHIRPTPITVGNSLHNQVNKHTKPDPLDGILDHIQKHPPPPTTKTITNERPNSNIMPDTHKETNCIQDIKGKQREEEDINTILDYEHRNNGENFVRTRCGRIAKKARQAHIWMIMHKHSPGQHVGHCAKFKHFTTF